MMEEDTMDERKLVIKLTEERFKAGVIRCVCCGKTSVPYYYFVNTRHPVIAKMWREYKRRHGIFGVASDEERITFEVSLLTDEAKRALWEGAQEEEE